MALNIPNIAAPERLSIFDAFMKTVQGGNELERQKYQNALLQSQAQFAPQMESSKNALMEAQAKRQNALANLPFGGEQLPGIAGQIVALENIKNKYGEDSKQYLFFIFSKATIWPAIPGNCS